MSKFKFWLSISITSLFIISFFTIYAGLKAYKDLNNKVLIVDKKIEVISKALQNSSAVSLENRAQIQELLRRIELIKKSQEDRLVEAVEKASKFTVSIVASKYINALRVRYVNPFGEDPYFKGSNIKIPVYERIGVQKEKIGAGSGFIISKDGLIVTNNHAVFDNSAEYTVLLPDGTQKVAAVIYKNPKEDIAILKIDGNNYSYARLGDSDKLKLGQTVVAIGNALGEFNNTVSVGVVSGLNRKIDAVGVLGVEHLEGLIQTDAAINEGNSGGPLINLDAEVVGINVAVNKNANNIGFAIPINKVKPTLKSLIY